MGADGGPPVPKPAHIDIWRLPTILKLEARLAHYEPPKRHTTRQGVQAIREAVEVDLYTDGEVVARALSPVLRVGDVVLTWGERLGPMHYRFRAVEPEMSRMAGGQTVELGWPVKRGTPPARRTPGALQLPAIT